MITPIPCTQPFLLRTNLRNEIREDIQQTIDTEMATRNRLRALRIADIVTTWFMINGIPIALGAVTAATYVTAAYATTMYTIASVACIFFVGSFPLLFLIGYIDGRLRGQLNPIFNSSQGQILFSYIDDRLREQANRIFNSSFPVSAKALSEEVCTICLEEPKDKEDVVFLCPSLHFFHKHCIRKWLATKWVDEKTGIEYLHDTCPSCREKSIPLIGYREPTETEMATWKRLGKLRDTVDCIALGIFLSCSLVFVVAANIWNEIRIWSSTPTSDPCIRIRTKSIALESYLERFLPLPILIASVAIPVTTTIGAYIRLRLVAAGDFN